MAEIVNNNVSSDELLTPVQTGTAAKLQFSVESIQIDAGTRHLRLLARDAEGYPALDRLLPANCNLPKEMERSGLLDPRAGSFVCERILVTGKLAAAVRERLGTGKQLLPSACLWMAAQDLVEQPENANVNTLAIIDLSASGYQIIGVDRQGRLKDDLLLTNPRCGAGSGINLDRVLQKLDLEHEQVDELLEDYLGEAGRPRREATPIRVDRCGVFSTSATISDKNQGIPLANALATTLKSEVLKTVKRLPGGFDKVYLSGRIFRWRFARDCAADLLHEKGVAELRFDPESDFLLDSLGRLGGRASYARLTQPEPRLRHQNPMETYPSFQTLGDSYRDRRIYRRLPDKIVTLTGVDPFGGRNLIMALDVGSTMAKIVLADADTGENLFLDACSNAGDTIQTVKQLFRAILALGAERLALRSIGITGSARYQVQQALSSIFPGLGGRVSVLVENYAHARGSIDQARQHIDWLARQGIEDVNRDRCILVDIGGEDTKISTIALAQGELFDNAMNTKCSAGTGSLMDTMSTMFGLDSVAEAQVEALTADRAFAINATCAVFLMENASKLQARGVPRDQILASSNWAIVENMARTLWRQLELPARAVLLLHGQTMMSDPLPLAVVHRLREHVGDDVYALVPPNPGHRACIGLVRSLQQAAVPGVTEIRIEDLLEAEFDKRLIQCKGKVCGDPLARCHRCALRWQGDDGRKIAFTVGGCTAINELISRKGQNKPVPPRDIYREIWEFIDSHHPRCEDPERIVIPRSFAVSDWAYLLARIVARLGLPVHVDNVRESDLAEAQPRFNVDCCAPQIGAVGQFTRLAKEPHGLILAPQIETLPTGGLSRGLTCTTNQGGIAIARNLALDVHPGARFLLFHFHLEALDAGRLSDQLRLGLAPLLERYGIDIDAHSFAQIVAAAIEEHLQLRRDTADLAARLAQEALDDGYPLAVVVGREYVLNPGIYDSHIRRLLRDRQMAVLPSYVLDVDLDPEYAAVYWRNPHFILTVLKAISRRSLHTRLRHPGLRELFRRIEQDPEKLLPVVQVSTFSCGPDSIIAHYVAEIMRERPFLLIQSDAVLKELAHLENRVNTYVKQLDQGLHAKLGLTGQPPFEIHSLDEMVATGPLNSVTDVVCLPTIADQRAVTSVFRAAGFTCIENYDDDSYDLQALVKTGRRAAGQAVCAPLAAVYSDLRNAIDEFARRKRAGDPDYRDKQRLILIDTQGSGPCRQGQYPGLHRLFLQKRGGGADRACNSLPGGSLFAFLLLEEEEGYATGMPEWMMIRIYQGIIMRGILQAIHFELGADCSDYAEYARFRESFRQLQSEVYGVLESYHGPGRFGRFLLDSFGDNRLVGLPLKYLLYRVHGRDYRRLLKDFVKHWDRLSEANRQRLEILVSGEGYMRLAQADEIFRILLGELGFRRFRLRVSPAMSYYELILREAEEHSLSKIEEIRGREARAGLDRKDRALLHAEQRRVRKIRIFTRTWRKVFARPLYRAAGRELPHALGQAVETSRELLPTYRPLGELAPYVGEALEELREGTDVVLNVAPNGCMVSTMGEALSSSIQHARGVRGGRIQTLLSAEGDVNEEELTLAALKATGPQSYYGLDRA